MYVLDSRFWAAESGEYGSIIINEDPKGASLSGWRDVAVVYELESMMLAEIGERIEDAAEDMDDAEWWDE
jgi:hypothetical protein